MQLAHLKKSLLGNLAIGRADGLPGAMQILLPATFTLLLLAGVATAIMAARSDEANDWVLHTIEVRQRAREVMAATQDAELAQRGYLLVGDREYLEPYAAIVASMDSTLTRLRTETGDNPAQQTKLDAIVPTLRKRLAIIDQTIELAKRGRRDEAIAIVKRGEGKELMDALRAQIAEFMEAELALLNERQARADSIRHWLLVFVGFTLASAAALGFLVYRSTGHYIRQLRERTSELEAEATLRKATEDTLRQAQKIEAVGQLSGGVAHDFNNLLTIIMGNIDTVARRIAQSKPDRDASELAAVLSRPVELAMQGARSAAQLTQRLLAFSRRQALDPVRLDVNKLVAGMSELLRRTLGETISVETVLAGGLWHSLVDANQLENAIINLAVNARDAMPEGGRLTLETANTYLDEAYTTRFGELAPGQYVLLSVADTGTGIAPDVLQRVFEPFFTTKDTGKGSGLGLAMVHGFVKQSGGHIRIYSEVGHGTTVKIYLPRVMEDAAIASAPAPSPAPSAAASRARDGETVLVVEDNEGVRDYACASLRDLGYEVFEAADAHGAHEMVKSGIRLDLLFTDVVLPGGISGRKLAEMIAVQHPHVPVLFTTGYTRNAIVHHGRLDPHVHLLSKPYTQQDLARKVRQLLDGEPTTGGRAAKSKVD